MKTSHIIGILGIAAAIVIIIVSLGNTSSYVTFETATENPESEYHVVGVLAEDEDLYYNPEENPNYFSFHMVDRDGNKSKVEYYNAKPQDFERSEQIVIIGQMTNSAFRADKILMKCPSKYQEEEIQLKQSSI